MIPAGLGGSLDELYGQAFSYMEATVHDLAGLVPAPRLVKRGSQRVFRYEECTADQALVQKLARLVSTLRAALLLLDRGFVQELGILKRVLDETQQDIFFILSGLRDPTDLDREFLDAFYEEEFDAETAVASTQKRKMIPRRKIRARNAKVISEVPGASADPRTVAEVDRTIYSAQSGYVHGASPHLMDMYGGEPPSFRFHMDGIPGTRMQQVCGEEFWHYVYRSLMVFAMAVDGLRGLDGSNKIRAYINWFERSKPGSGES